MKQGYFEELIISMYPSSLLHHFGVNGKVSGSIYAAGEMEGVLPIVHGPRGCGYHYRFSARRRHYPYFNIISSELTEKDIVFGGEEKLYNTVCNAYKRYSPRLILIIPTPVSDIINDDIESVVKRVQKEGINVIAIKSELFSHRDKNYTRKRFAEVAKQKFNQGKNLDFDITGCGYTEALYSVVNNIMAESKPIPHSVNIETIGWGRHGRQIIQEIEDTLGKAGVSINSHFPSTAYENLTTMARASLNIVRRIRWAKQMKEKFGTPYLQINTTGNYSGLDGICNFYRDVANELGISERMEKIISVERTDAESSVKPFKEDIKRYRMMIISRDIQSLPYLTKKYSVDYGMNILCCSAVLTEKNKENLKIDDVILKNLLARIKDSLDMYAPAAKFSLNAEDAELMLMAKGCDAVMGTGDYYYEKLGIVVINPIHEDISLSFQSYVRTVKRICDKLANVKNKPDLILNQLGFDRDNYLILNEYTIQSAEEMWHRMWLNKKGDSR